MAGHDSSSVYMFEENNIMYPLYKKVTCKHIELAEYRTIKSGQKIQKCGDKVLQHQSKEFKVTMSLVSSGHKYFI